MSSPVEFETNFGFEKVSSTDKTRLVKDVFHRVANHYDLMNDVMSGGIHRLWKKKLIQMMREKMMNHQSCHLIDVAGGTGDIALEFIKTNNQSTVTLCDLTSSMVEVGRDRALNQGIFKNINWICGNASFLPFSDNYFDGYSIGFGLRNVTDRQAALCEAYRVLKPGASFFCLEFSKVSNRFLQKVYHHYSFSFIPKFGKWIAKDESAYQYLVESIKQFPSQHCLAQEIEHAGFKKVEIYNLSGGIAAIHLAIKA